MINSSKKYKFYNWLPGLIKNDEMLKKNAYRRFVEDFMQKRTYLNEQIVVVNKNDKLTFNHLITEGQGSNRTHSTTRCQRIPWIRALIQNAGTDKVMYWLKNEKGIYVHYLALPDYSYLVVLKSNNDKTIGLSTAYYVDNESRDKLIEQYENYNLNKNRIRILRNKFQRAELRNNFNFEKCFSLKMYGLSEEDISKITRIPLHQVKNFLKRKF